MQIQWYPGHMAKARRMLEENLKLIDVVVEIVDARVPIASRNPDFDGLFANKERVILLNKSDLADQTATDRWQTEYARRGFSGISFVSTKTGRRKQAISLIEEACRERVERMRLKGVTKVVRAIVVGIPNVGKSTFINCIAGASRAQVGDKPGVTKGKQWVKISPYLELLDTPGLLWPKLESQACARHLAYIGSIKDDIMDVERLATQLMQELSVSCPEALKNRYACVEEGMSAAEFLPAVSKSRGFLLSGGQADTERAARIVLDEFRAGKIARVTLELPGDEEKLYAEEE